MDFLSLENSNTDIWLVVSVPVLSEQITDVQPSVSTDGRLRTMAFFLAILLVPRARQVVITAGRPRGPFWFSGGHLISDFSNLCLHPCCHGNPDGTACCNVGTLDKGRDLYVQLVSIETNFET
ncbi:hypothetical protein EYF80_039252 [Liparis tanakae]|uniref:Uncharacterized protein n=1 Tax=Liparis tanakae TaxID=230148 RepID=A0A4Z2GBE1_9TELE|nr:hypothetical protein EYF80_039252 [Liparis tanakae]